MSSADRSEMIRFACPKCGRAMQARPEYVGRATRCPGCQHQLAIPGADGSSVAAGPRASGGRGKGWAIVLALLVVVGAAGAFAAWKYWPRGQGGPAGGFVLPEVDDLALLPADAQALASFRLADAWQRPMVQKAVKDLRQKEPNQPDPALELERLLGLAPGEVERFSIVLLDADRELGYGVVRTAKPYDQAKVLSRLAGATERTHQGKSYYVGGTASTAVGAICFASPQVLIVGREAGVQRGLEALTPRLAGPLASVVAQAREGQAVGVFGLHPAAGGARRLRENQALALLGQMKTATGALRLGEKASAEARLATDSEAQAKELHASIKFVLIGAPLMILGNQQLSDAQKKTLLQLLRGVKVSQKGAELHGRLEMDEETAAALLVLALAQAGR